MSLKVVIKAVFKVLLKTFSVSEKTINTETTDQSQKTTGDFIRATNNYQKQAPRGFPRKTYSENMQQIYWRTPMPKCDFNKVANQ